MEPFYFGDDAMQLYGVYHPAPPAGPSVDQGVLLCPPAGQEYMRMHRSYRWLAELLTRKGYSALRFDYPGMGDSSGELTDQTIGDWVAAASLALQELTALSGPGRRTIIGARLGALVAANLAAANSVEKLVLWEPRDPPSVFAEEMQAIIARRIQPRANFVDEDEVIHFNGFPFSPGFLASVADCPLSDLDLSSVGKILLLTSGAEGSMSGLHNTLQQNHSNVECCYVEGLSDWNTVDQMGGIFLPQAVLRTIDEWV